MKKKFDEWNYTETFSARERAENLSDKEYKTLEKQRDSLIKRITKREYHQKMTSANVPANVEKILVK